MLDLGSLDERWRYFFKVGAKSSSVPLLSQSGLIYLPSPSPRVSQKPRSHLEIFNESVLVTSGCGRWARRVRGPASRALCLLKVIKDGQMARDHASVEMSGEVEEVKRMTVIKLFRAGVDTMSGVRLWSVCHYREEETHCPPLCFSSIFYVKLSKHQQRSANYAFLFVCFGYFQRSSV